MVWQILKITLVCINLLNSKQNLILYNLIVLIPKMQSVFAYHVTFCHKLENKILQIMHFKCILNLVFFVFFLTEDEQTVEH